MVAVPIHIPSDLDLSHFLHHGGLYFCHEANVQREGVSVENIISETPSVLFSEGMPSTVDKLLSNDRLENIVSSDFWKKDSSNTKINLEEDIQTYLALKKEKEFLLKFNCRRYLQIYEENGRRPWHVFHMIDVDQFEFYGKVKHMIKIMDKIERSEDYGALLKEYFANDRSLIV